MTRVKKVAIVGGGIGGMTLAIALRRRGIAAEVIEQGRREDQLGTGINLQGNALRALAQVGLLDDCLAVGFGWNSITNRDGAGNILNSVNLGPPDADRPAAMGIMRTAFADILARHATRAGAVIRYQTMVDDLEQGADGVTLALSDGSHLTADVVVAADGVYSQIRSRIFGDQHKPRYAGQGVWRYTVPRPHTLDGFTVFRAPSGGTVGFLPLAPDLAYYFYLETTDEVLRFREEELPAALASRLSEFTAPEIRDALALIEEGRHISFRRFDILLMPPPWHRGRVVLLGDAAHSLTPQLTSGGGMAIEDAVVLADELDRDVPAEQALAAYTDRREARVRRIFENSYRICELEKQRSDGSEGTRIMVESFQFLAQPY